MITQDDNTVPSGVAISDRAGDTWRGCDVGLGTRDGAAGVSSTTVVWCFSRVTAVVACLLKKKQITISMNIKAYPTWGWGGAFLPEKIT